MIELFETDRCLRSLWSFRTAWAVSSIRATSCELGAAPHNATATTALNRKSCKRAFILADVKEGLLKYYSRNINTSSPTCILYYLIARLHLLKVVHQVVQSETIAHLRHYKHDHLCYITYCVWTRLSVSNTCI